MAYAMERAAVRFVLFYHSLVSDWNHPSAHFLRGVATELLTLGHSVRIFEPTDGWSLHNLREQGGDGVVKAFHATYPHLRSSFYDPASLDLDETLADADVVIAHEWNDASLLRRLGNHRAITSSYKLLFHDAPHRALNRPLEVRARDLSRYDGVLAASEGLRQLYENNDWAAHAWTWREAVDTKIFRPGLTLAPASLDLVWIGSWGHGERVDELNEFLVDPIRTSGSRSRFYGARYPEEAWRALRAAGIDYGGWIPDFGIPSALAAGRFTVHVPRRMQAHGLPHTPMIRLLQALACGMPVVSAPWEGCEELFSSGTDLLIGRDGQQIARHLTELRNDWQLGALIGGNGYEKVVTRHSCEQRVRELLTICQQIGVNEPRANADSAELSTALSMRHPRRVIPPQRSNAPAAWN
jgi:spore maturation protein CgeB